MGGSTGRQTREVARSWGGRAGWGDGARLLDGSTVDCFCTGRGASSDRCRFNSLAAPLGAPPLAWREPLRRASDLNGGVHSTSSGWRCATSCVGEAGGWLTPSPPLLYSIPLFTILIQELCPPHRCLPSSPLPALNSPSLHSRIHPPTPLLLPTVPFSSPSPTFFLPSPTCSTSPLPHINALP